MSLSWLQRKTKLASLLKSQGDEDADGIALDRLLHGQNVIGKTPKTVEIDALRFRDKDLDVVGTLEFGQYGVIDVVTCRLNGQTYVRKSTDKRFALRARDQCFPQFERDILLQAFKSETTWAPHLLCAFQTPTHLNLVMDYAEGGSLWDVLESSPHSGKLLEDDLQWWIPQVVSAIHWCHSQGFAHRDIKPQNFVLTRDAHILLIDFGSAAPLLPTGPDGCQLLPKRYCILPCGTCDYISPEILMAHEEVLLALEMEDEDEYPSYQSLGDDEPGYGVETDWWSFGAMIYELAYGVAPFFANEIRHTYQKIMNHERSLRFDESIPVPSVYKDFISKLLTHPERRIGRHNIMEITDHPLFEAVNWTNLHEQRPPEGLHLPQFTYNEQPPAHVQAQLASSRYEESLSQGFQFSALFQSSPLPSTTSPAISAVLRQTPMKSAMQEEPSAPFIGFSWGPTSDAFPSTADPISPPLRSHAPITPRVSSLATPSHLSTPRPQPVTNALTTPIHRYNTFSTPNNRTYAFTPFRTNTLPRTAGRTSQRRDLSDREAMKQLVDCVGMSARKKVLESGRKPKLLNNPASVRSGYGSLTRKELRFKGDPIPMPDYRTSSFSMSHNASISLSYASVTQQQQPNISNPLDPQHTGPLLPTAISNNVNNNHRPDSLDNDAHFGYSGSETEITDSEGPPSPSPRPGSSLSNSRRSATPTAAMLMGGGGSFSNLSMRSHTPTLLLASSSSKNSIGRMSGSGSSMLAATRSMSLNLGHLGLGAGSSGLGQGQAQLQSATAGASVPRMHLPDQGGRDDDKERDVSLEVKAADEVVEDEEKTPRKEVISDDRRTWNEGLNYSDKNIDGKSGSNASEERKDYREQRTNREGPAAVTEPQRHDVAFKRFRNSYTAAQAYHDDDDAGEYSLDNLDRSERDRFDELEKRLSLLIGGIEDIEKKLAKAKLVIR
ncbi:hypothetical protein Agabi119p4_11043 [Agaricus bisporus var. burnettii]|uniref:Protein kinase domain-containing protein n=1 Tax=Agaricus bisporus var. burnettii TaxID=192524 RepID=A0A8H7C0V2_AGABI|nr:hypothetical protein Agabi119p4_11043 [Agaricus bisporus var. burnettii]